MTTVPLARWLWRSYVRAAVVPLLFIELTFLAIYWASTALVYERNAEAIGTLSEDELQRTAEHEARTIAEQLEAVSALTQLYAAETGRALATPYTPPPEETERHALSPEGVYHTTRDLPGHSAVFVSGIVPVDAALREAVGRTAQLDPLMKAITEANPLITQIYLNTKDSYNRIYPYFDVLSAYPAKMDIPSYNFYYEADAAHNPARAAVWTDAYVDPAGAGWMVSSIAPVYQGGSLEAVVGIDITIRTIVEQVLSVDLPWNGFAMLVGRDGTILAMPEAAEEALALRELTEYGYHEAIAQDTFKPDDFNIFKRDDTAAIAAAIRAQRAGLQRLDLAEPMTAAWSEVAGPGWRLVVMAPQSAILAQAETLREHLTAIGAGMVAVLVIFYGVFFVFLLSRARAMSRRVAEPLSAVEGLMTRIGGGYYEQEAPPCEVSELDVLGRELTAMGRRLGAAHRAVQAALIKERRLADDQRQFITVVSHEFRTPIAIIDGAAQALERRADRMTPEKIRERAGSLRTASQRLHDVVAAALHFCRTHEAGEAHLRPAVPIDLAEVIDAIRRDLQAAFPDHLFQADLDPLPLMNGDEDALRIALSALLDNAFRYSPPGSTVTVTARAEGPGLRLTVSDGGPGIEDDELPRVFDRFFRGRSGLDSHGAGLGLSLAKTFIDLHGGTVTLHRRPEGGLEAVVSLPLTPDARISAPQAAE